MKGFGQQFSHHGEIMLGIFIIDGVRTRGSVTLKSNQWKSKAVFDSEGAYGIEVFPAHKTKALHAAQLVCDKLGIPRKGKIEILESPPERFGFGSSTADICATLYAIGNAANHIFTPKEITDISCQCEPGTDAIMYQNAVLFNFRTGEIVEDFGVPIPSFFVAGFNASKEKEPFPDFYRTRPFHNEYADQYTAMRVRFREAIKRGDRKEIASIATESAHIRQHYIPKPNWDEICALKEKTHALGIQVAHAGMAVGLMFEKKENASLACVQIRHYGFDPWIGETR